MKTISNTPMPASQLDQLEELAHAAPAELHDVLNSLVASLREGDEIVAVDPQKAITPSQAAKHLGMSRTHLYKLLDNGTIEFHRVGRDRRIFLRDLKQFAVQRDTERRDLAERFSSQDRDRSAAVDEIVDLL
ncbi:DNA-binding protein [Brachybacterium vulturis]|uniref:DNA-binding protein n=1 Tax=Brachybacterium vulturis TaxID=2017484 RepID=A0A291GIT3_9MICO|nr:excisionase family DNA-binding protein [Brachybacterium vulturis]ATG50097.1 DNA-binding protein [Brachybacterium vulturis]